MAGRTSHACLPACLGCCPCCCLTCSSEGKQTLGSSHFGPFTIPLFPIDYSIALFSLRFPSSPLPLSSRFISTTYFSPSSSLLFSFYHLYLLPFSASILPFTLLSSYYLDSYHTSTGCCFAGMGSASWELFGLMACIRPGDFLCQAEMPGQGA